MIRIGVLTVSDRSARGEREDLSGPAVAAAAGARIRGRAGGRSGPSCPMSGPHRRDAASTGPMRWALT